MKTFWLFFSFLSFSFTPLQQLPKDRIGVSGPIHFQNTVFLLAKSYKPDENTYIQQYIPENELLNKFNQMMTVQVVVTNTSIHDAATTKINELIIRKQTDNLCNYTLSPSQDGRQLVLDYVISTENKMGLSQIEFNMYRYVKITLQNKRKVILLYSYTRRGYGTQAESVFRKLAIDHGFLINDMMQTNMPQIFINDQK
ncbi:hypothetical protein [Flavobacterium aciduliphilum]|nr:hypothetical protein [Flavobacterium aciduliphilum]